MGLFGNGSILTIVEASTKQYSTSLVVSPEVQHLKSYSCPAFLRQLSSRVLKMADMDGAVIFTCPRPWVGVFKGTSKVSPP